MWVILTMNQIGCFRYPASRRRSLFRSTNGFGSLRLNAQSDHGMTPLALAKTLGWDKVVALLKSKGAK